MVKTNRIAYGVRVKLNSEFQEKCIGDKYLKEERILFMADSRPYNDAKGDYVPIRGGSLTNSGYAYLNEINLEFEVPETPLYSWEENSTTDIEASDKYAQGIETVDTITVDSFKQMELFSCRKCGFLAGCKFKEEQIRGKQK